MRNRLLSKTVLFHCPSTFDEELLTLPYWIHFVAMSSFFPIALNSIHLSGCWRWEESWIWPLRCLLVFWLYRVLFFMHILHSPLSASSYRHLQLRQLNFLVQDYYCSIHLREAFLAVYWDLTPCCFVYQSEAHPGSGSPCSIFALPREVLALMMCF